MNHSRCGPYLIDDKPQIQFSALVVQIFTEEPQKMERFTVVDETGTILARSIDRRAAETMRNTFQRSNSVTNSSEVKRLISFWATRLREGLGGFGQ